MTPLLYLAGGLKARMFRDGYIRKHADARRAFAIHAYVGGNGSGKSLAMMHDTRASLESGRPVLSTVRLLDYDNPRPCPGGELCDDPLNHDLGVMLPVSGGQSLDDSDDEGGAELLDLSERFRTGAVHAAAHPLYTKFTDFRQLVTWRAGDVLMDEVVGVASSRESHAIPVQIANFLMQLRRADVLLRWSCINYARADKIIREATQAVTDCTGMAPASSLRDDGTPRLWRDRRLFRWVTFDAFAFDEFSAHKRDTMPTLNGQWFWRPESGVDGMYSTLDSVAALGAATEAGMCMVCGGRRSMPRCSCDTNKGEDETGAHSAPADVPAPVRTVRRRREALT